MDVPRIATPRSGRIQGNRTKRAKSFLGYGEHPNRKCISGSDGGLIPARSRDHTGLWLLSVAKLIAKVRTFAADFCSKESPAEPMSTWGKKPGRYDDERGCPCS